MVCAVAPEKPLRACRGQWSWRGAIQPSHALCGVICRAVVALCDPQSCRGVKPDSPQHGFTSDVDVHGMSLLGLGALKSP